MDTRPKGNYGRDLIIRLAVLLLIGVLSYAEPGRVVGQEVCGGAIVTIGLPNPDGSEETLELLCNGCRDDDKGCWSGYCCEEDPTGTAWGFDEEGTVIRYDCGLNWSTCDDEDEGGGDA